jgi:hypothetical protein
VEERFPYRKPPIGKNKAAVVLDDEMRIEHPLLKSPLTVPTSRIASVVRVTEVDPNEPPLVLQRDVRVLHLQASAFTDANVVLLFRSPVRIERFKFGAENGLPISARERKRGLDIEGVGVTVEEPDQLHNALLQRRVPSAPSVALALKALVGEAMGEHLVRRRETMEKARARARLLAIGFGVLWTTLIAARFALGGEAENVPASTIVGLVVSSLVWAALIAALVASWDGSSARRPVRERVSGWHGVLLLGVVLASVGVPIVIAGWMASHLGTPRLLAYGLVGGVPGGFLCGIGLRSTRRT